MIPAAYHGPGFTTRRAAHHEDVAAGRHWAPRTSGSEYQPLLEVVLGRPGALPDLPADTLQHLRPVDPVRLDEQVQALADCFRRLGVTVHELRPDTASDGRSPAPGVDRANLVFARDLFVPTPGGVVISRMGSEIRAGETRHAARLLADLHVPILATVHGTATLEGADVLWVRPDTVLVGVGNRTDEAGAAQLAACLGVMGVSTVRVPLPRQVQHLLGLVQIVDRDLAVVRDGLLAPEVLATLTGFGLRLVPVPESEEVTAGQGMNVVCVAPRTVVMPAGAPGVRERLRAGGIDVAAEVEIGELCAAAGGIGCATGILARGRAA